MPNQSGMGILMKSMGLDPEAIMAQVEDMKVSTIQTVTHFDTRLNTVEQSQQQILMLLTSIANHLNLQDGAMGEIKTAIEHPQLTTGE